ncbi:MAG: sigma-54-dependent Fis family transcriptional regulator, partial [Myxococcales bacterium]|nr:sigma-54-dependent Fis family transcriptional regulator [Myxococcales bacterium]
EVDGVTVRLERAASAAAAAAEPRGRDAALDVSPLVDRLASVEDPREALALLLEAVMQASGADSGAVILREQDDYTVAVSRRRDGGVVDEAAALLSDHIVREVLSGGEQVHLGDAAGDPSYASIPSVALLKLRSVLCVPMPLSGLVLGAIFIGKHGAEAPFSRALREQLAMLASLAVPLIVQLRRLPDGAAAGTASATSAADTSTAAERLLVGESEGMQRVRALIDRVAPSDLSVLIRGETGTGKELVARAVHATSTRGDRPLIALNCAAVPEGLLEAELFGAKRGAFTGAVSDRKGRIEMAHRSTLFLDELGDMPLAMQASLLRVLETRELSRLGDNEVRRVDFRLIGATHKDLHAEVAAGRFRQDLLYRLEELTIELPPLRQRGGDVLLLAQLFLRQTERQLGLGSRRLAHDAAEALLVHGWPGNVRELRATMRRAAILCDGQAIERAHLGLSSSGASAPAQPATLATERSTTLGDLERPLAAARDDFLAAYVGAVLERCGGDRDVAAKRLDISVRSLYRYLKR